MAARAAPDGHTLFFGTVSTLVIEPVLRTNVRFDPLRDFVPITIITESPFILVVSASFAAKQQCMVGVVEFLTDEGAGAN